MAIIIDVEYTNATPADANYPQGSFKNATTETSRDGTPLEKAWPNDIYGFLQAIIAAGGITPSGEPDTALASDYLDGLRALFATAAQGALADTALQPTDLTAYLPYVGEIRSFAFQAPPPKWLELGQAVSRTTYSALFDKIGTTYGPGDGVNTFDLPPNGRFLRSWDGVVGFGSVVEDSIESHTHTATGVHQVTSETQYQTQNTGTGPIAFATTTGPTGGTETAPKHINVLFCIYAGV